MDRKQYFKAYYEANKEYFKAYKQELINRVLSELYTENDSQTIPLTSNPKHNSSYIDTQQSKGGVS